MLDNASDLIFSRIGSPIFEVADPPWSSQNLQLALDLLNQERHRRIKDDGFCSAAFSRDKTLRGGVLSRSGVSVHRYRAVPTAPAHS